MSALHLAIASLIMAGVATDSISAELRIDARAEIAGACALILEENRAALGLIETYAPDAKWRD